MEFPRSPPILLSSPRALQHPCAGLFSRRNCAAPIREQSGCLLATAKFYRCPVLPAPAMNEESLRGRCPRRISSAFQIRRACLLLFRTERSGVEESRDVSFKVSQRDVSTSLDMTGFISVLPALL